MRTLTAIGTATAAAFVLLTGSPASGATKTVQVDDDFFNPSSLVIREGNTVLFDWVGVNDHNVYKKTGPGRDFDSGPTNEPGVNFQRTFKKRGDYVLGCVLHEKMLMNLKVKRR